MKRWYPIVFKAGESGDADLVAAVEAAIAYMDEYDHAKDDLIVQGRIENISARIPGMTAQRFAELQDLESILEHVETRLKHATTKHTQKFMEHYNRTLTWQQANQYAGNAEEVKLIKGCSNR